MGHPERGRFMRLGWVRAGDFRLLNRRISETVQDMTKVAIDRKSHTRFRLVPKSTTLVDAEIALVCIELSSFSSLFDGCDLHRHHIKST